MIALLYGIVTVVDAPQGRVLVTTSSGVGYEVLASFDRINTTDRMTPQRMYIWHVIREAEQKLYGFRTLEERELALQLGACDHIGPTLASRLAQKPDYLGTLNLIHSGDVKKLAGECKGLGEKGAATIIRDCALYVAQARTTQFAASTGSARFTAAARAIEVLGFAVDPAALAVIIADAQVTPEQAVAAYLKGLKSRTSL